LINIILLKNKNVFFLFLLSKKTDIRLYNNIYYTISINSSQNQLHLQMTSITEAHFPKNLYEIIEEVYANL